MHPFRIRVGINTGYCTVGNFGSKNKMDYTIIGNQVNIAKRLEETAQDDQIIISHETWAHIKEQIYCIKRNPVMVKGIDIPIQTYQVLDFHERLLKREHHSFAIGMFIEKANTAPPDTLVRDVNLGRRLNDAFNVLIVVDENDHPLGLVINYYLTRILISHSHRAQFFEQPVTDIMDRSPLIFESNISLLDVVHQAMAREPQKMYDPVIVTEGGSLKGIVPIHSILETLAEYYEEQNI
jgi:CBS domain-containing protein